MTCAEFESHLSAYMDGELPRWTKWKVHNHLRECEACSCCLRELEAVDEAILSAVDAAPDPEYVTGAVMHRLPAMPPAWRRHSGMLPWAAGAAVAAMQAVALYGVYWWGYSQGRGITLPPGAVESAAPARTRTSGPSPTSSSLPAQQPLAGSVFSRTDPSFKTTVAETGAAIPVSLSARAEEEKRRPERVRVNALRRPPMLLPAPGGSNSLAAPLPARPLQINGARP